MKNYREAFAGAERTVRLNVRMVILGLLLFGVNEVCLKTIVSWSWIHFYFNDLLAGMVFMAYCNLVFLPDDPRGLGIRRGMVLIAAAGVFWEYITPLYLSRSVSDVHDLLAYGIGGLLCQIEHKRRGMV
ncbi:hypothetical protein [Enterocloster asparagiformis]|uniref:hypothetical protein n=1 Tax=Enterocloster asparagiformis TaxID=333367 RepID=UPI002A8022B5|nr:hypothetical protein [Enterocloster asparagiformis]